MNEPQVWTLIGVFGATLVGMFTMMSTMFVRVIRAEIGGLRGEMSAEIGGLRGEMSAKFDGVQAQFAKVEMRLDHLDRDIQALTRQVFPDRE